MAKAPKKMANGGPAAPTTSMANLTTDQIVQQIYANQARRAAAANAPAPVVNPNRGLGDPGVSNAFRQINDPLALTGGKITARRILDPLNVLPGNGRSLVNTAADPLNIFGAGGGKRNTLSHVLDPAGVFGGGKKRGQGIYTTPDGVVHNGGGGVALTPEQKQAQRALGQTYRQSAQNTGIVPPAAQPTGLANAATQAIQRIPGYADGGKVINRMPNGKHRGC